MNIKKLIFIFLIFQFFLTSFPLYKETGVKSTGDIIPTILEMFEMFLFISFWSILFAIMALLIKKKNLLIFISKFTFFIVSTLNILILLYTNLLVIVGGPLGEGGIIFAFFPIFGFYISIAGIILGIIIYFIKDQPIITKLLYRLLHLTKK